jgi:hypothetical protein
MAVQSIKPAAAREWRSVWVVIGVGLGFLSVACMDISEEWPVSEEFQKPDEVF